jgi:hypothetical protein
MGSVFFFECDLHRHVDNLHGNSLKGNKEKISDRRVVSLVSDSADRDVAAAGQGGCYGKSACSQCEGKKLSVLTKVGPLYRT